MTGYRARDISDEELEDILRETFKSEDKSLE
jgi:hypothetical protein